MKRDVLTKLPPEMIRKLARDKGYAGDDADDIELVARWLLEFYVAEGSRSARDRSVSLLSAARRSLASIRSRFTVETDKPAGPLLAGTRSEKAAAVVEMPDAPVSSDPAPERGDRHPGNVPSDPAMRTMTLAHIYESQGMLVEALCIYQELARRDPTGVQAREGIERVRARLEADEEPPPSGPEPGRPAEGRAPRRRGDSSGRGSPQPHRDLPDPLPERHGKDEAILMMVTPRLLYACWEVTPETQRCARDQMKDPGAQLALRISRIATVDTMPEVEVFATIDITQTSGEYFFHGAEPGFLYHAEVGLRHDDLLVTLARSKAILTPHGAPSDRLDEQWMEVDQGPLDFRAVVPTPPVPIDRTHSSPREMAFSRLHAIGPEAYSSLTGLELERLHAILLDTRRPVTSPATDLPSSDCFHDPRT